MSDNAMLPNNSHKYRDIQKQKEESKKIERVTHGEVKFKKKSAFRQFIDQFIQEDGQKIKSYVCNDVLIPSIKQAVSDIVSNTINLLFYGDAGRSRRNVADRVSYKNYNSYSSYSNPSNNYQTQRNNAAFMFENVCFNSRREAVDVLDRMFEILDLYGVVSVSDVNQLVGISGSFTDNNYGWTVLNSNGNYISSCRDGFELNLPRPTPIDNN